MVTIVTIVKMMILTKTSITIFPMTIVEAE
jgi:hypothetical protein